MIGLKDLNLLNLVLIFLPNELTTGSPNAQRHWHGGSSLTLLSHHHAVLLPPVLVPLLF